MLFLDLKLFHSIIAISFSNVEVGQTGPQLWELTSDLFSQVWQRIGKLDRRWFGYTSPIRGSGSTIYWEEFYPWKASDRAACVNRGFRIHFNQKINQSYLKANCCGRSLTYTVVLALLSIADSLPPSLVFTSHGISQAIFLPICHWWAASLSVTLPVSHAEALGGFPRSHITGPRGL